MKLVKLTAPNGSDCYINPAHVLAVGRLAGNPTSTIQWAGGNASEARESPAEIAAEIERQTGETPAPEPEPAKVDPAGLLDPVALLAEGKRLRFRRDAGGMGERVPAEVDVTVRETDDWAFGWAMEPGDDDSNPLFCGDYNTGEHGIRLSSEAMAELLFDIGYRFDHIVESDD